ncbi:Uu.00g050980.m01.CDS01 [Anthostomella pinea]|uniref:Uu.00g050980.m01.CDS01 n=1 Tax=Anthostomella pinea TaxID=933095 RepID=A0AAI8VSR9_9PEZI|nr:Uu.00g050980.m01.CDS01 [Anthostomella pinea]
MPRGELDRQRIAQAAKRAKQEVHFSDGKFLHHYPKDPKKGQSLIADTDDRVPEVSDIP